MIRYFQNRFALSEKGAKDLRRGIAYSTLLNLALMLPPTYLFLFLMDCIGTETQTRQHTLWFYLLLAAGLAVGLLRLRPGGLRTNYSRAFTPTPALAAPRAGKMESPTPSCIGWV